MRYAVDDCTKSALNRYSMVGKDKEKGLTENPQTLYFSTGAEDWTRTSTPLRAQEPESCVSTNSTTSASFFLISSAIHMCKKKMAISLAIIPFDLI